MSELWEKTPSIQLENVAGANNLRLAVPGDSVKFHRESHRWAVVAIAESGVYLGDPIAAAAGRVWRAPYTVFFLTWKELELKIRGKKRT